MTASQLTAPWTNPEFSTAVDVTMLQPRADIRNLCAQDRALPTAKTGPVRPIAARRKTVGSVSQCAVFSFDGLYR